MEPNQTPPAKKIESVLRKQTNWQNLWFYQKTVVLYRMTYAFTRRFLPAFGDRTVDQMVHEEECDYQKNNSLTSDFQ